MSHTGARIKRPSKQQTMAKAVRQASRGGGDGGGDTLARTINSVKPLLYSEGVFAAAPMNFDSVKHRIACAKWYSKHFCGRHMHAHSTIDSVTIL